MAAKRGRPTKTKPEKTNEQKALELIADNPGLLEALVKLGQSVAQKDSIITLDEPPLRQNNIIHTQPKGRIYRPAKPQVAFDDPNVGQAERKFDKKKYGKNFKPTERAAPIKKQIVTCKCGRSEEVAQHIYTEEFGYTCPQCAKRRGTER